MKTIAVIGAGTMGNGIAHTFAQSGFTVKLIDISEASSSTYPIISSKEAFENLKMGNYWPVSDTSSNKVVIRKIYLAYFEPVNLTQFMQPIYVLEGDGGFVAYVRAVTDTYAK